MNGEKINIISKSPRVLVAPLDWGLGHATRCIPIINELLVLGCEVLIAANGATKDLLQIEFPSLMFLSLRGYTIKYSRNSFWLPAKLLIQLPKLFLGIFRENRWLQGIVQKHQVTMVISDNRPGMYHKTVPCIYITHQLHIITGHPFTEWMTNKIHDHFIKRYTECWVPDAEDKNGLAGKLSHPTHMPGITVKYMGPLSRFVIKEEERKYELLILLSGPEPQRTIFEQLLLKELVKYEGTALLVRGLPGQFHENLAIPENLEIKEHLAAVDLNKAINQSGLVICRCGYTSIMDLICLGKRAILIPTPGQTEQEYLGGYLGHKKLFYSALQRRFSLQKALREEENYLYDTVHLNRDGYKLVIKSFLKSHSSVT